MEQTILTLFAGVVEKQEMLSALTEEAGLHGYSYSEVHTVTAIGTLKEPNVTGLADYLHVTRGAVSKITKKLLKAGLVETYKQPGNQQKVFFRLTEKGQKIFQEQADRYAKWLRRDTEFLQQYSKKELKFLEQFLKDCNHFLSGQIDVLGSGEKGE